MSTAVVTQKPKREYVKHGDISRLKLQQAKRLRAIDGTTLAGKQAKEWRAYALERKGGKGCSIDLKQKIEAATFALWRV